MGLPPKVVACKNPDCDEYFLKMERAQKYCCFKCGDALRSRKYRRAHPDRIAAKVKETWLAKKDILSARHKKWAAANQEYLRTYNREYYDRRGAQYYRNTWKRWYSQNRKSWASYVTNRRAQRDCRVSPSERLTPSEWDAILKAWNYKCAYCGEPYYQLTQDHVIPFAKGGKHIMSNVVPACLSCNSSKRDMDADEFRRKKFGSGKTWQTR